MSTGVVERGDRLCGTRRLCVGKGVAGGGASRMVTARLCCLPRPSAAVTRDGLAEPGLGRVRRSVIWTLVAFVSRNAVVLLAFYSILLFALWHLPRIYRARCFSGAFSGATGAVGPTV